MNFEEAARRIHLGRSIAFFGAGFSRDAKNHQGRSLADAADLALELSQAAGEEEELPLRLAAQIYESRKCEPGIRNLIREFYRAAEVSTGQLHIASLPWAQIYTTNYDDVIEECRRREGTSVNSVTVLDRPRDLAGYTNIAHLHGYVERISDADWESAFALTDRQYAADILTHSGWPERFRSDAAYADAIFFFGYSLSDLDIARLLYRDPSLRAKTFFVIGESAGRATELTVEPYGTVVPRNIEDVATIFPVADAAEAARPTPFLASLVEQELAVAESAPTREQVTDFLVKGQVESKLIIRDLVNGSHDYYVAREAISEATRLLDAGPMRVLFHSRLGEGKTTALIEFEHYCLAEGRRVLVFNGDPDGLPHDVNYLASLGSADQQKIVVIFEHCFSFSRQIKHLLERFPLLSVILTTRSGALQTRIGDLNEAFGDDFRIFDIDGIGDQEAPEFDDILYANGLWGPRQGDRTEERLRYIERECKSNLATLLVHVCRSSDLFERIKREFVGLDKQPPDIKRSVLAALSAAHSGVKLNVAQLCEVVQSDLFKYGANQANEIVREFVDFAHQQVSVRSPAFAQAVLQDVVPDHVILEHVPGLLVRLDRLRENSAAYDDLFKGLMRFGFIENIITNPDKERKLVAYFEAIRASGVGLNNPQFWLQYAIACMSFEDYRNAADHFATAFGLASRRGGYDPYQIENHYAKFLLRSRLNSNYWDDYFDAFAKANDILQRQVRNFQEGFYPYRVASNYLDYVEAHHSKFSADQLERVADWCAQILAVSESAPPAVRRSIYWSRARKTLQAARDIISEVQPRARRIPAA
ncbi:SIR2 family protein [Sphingomonas sp. BN140010]|uniref:SIR2 family protein n=1 Tax=Sphingomonas arvum TaxID=2992113 RepID=A0ABT3JE67_9SPHN|nr:SIR2 family protein [Sphingomonas sp. BN140010]MCW3797373.1 SIR2 family protein [Sphingomonas sp. BN140010]